MQNKNDWDDIFLDKDVLKTPEIKDFKPVGFAVLNSDLVPQNNKINFHLKILGTGSSGNCIILNDEIALDCGVSKFSNHFDRLDRLKLKTIFISHAHNDHCNGLSKTIDKDFINLTSIVFPTSYITNKDFIKDSNLQYIDKLPIHLKNTLPSNCVILKRFDVAHDVANDGYIFYYQGKIILYATDIGRCENVYVGYKYENKMYTFYTLNDLEMFSGLNYTAFDVYIIECNHDKKVLLENANKHSGSKKNYFTRSLNVHLSTIDCNRILNYTKNKPVLLVHRSIENLPINKETYFFMDKNNENYKNNVFIAINPFEKNKYEKIKDEFNLTTELKLEI